MYTSQIQKCLHSCQNFLGVFSLDTIPRFIENGMLISNTAPSNAPGVHWVAMIVFDRIGFYFDSYGEPPKEPFERLLNNSSDEWFFNSTQLQSVSSTVCGQWCIDFIKYIVKSLPYSSPIRSAQNYSSTYSPSYEYNDAHVEFKHKGCGIKYGQQCINKECRDRGVMGLPQQP